MRHQIIPFHGVHCVRLEAAGGATALIALHGAQVLSWIPADGRERLFLSRQARFGEGAAIRGGVPVIFPQFGGRGALPKHGFARTLPWQFLGCEDHASFALASGEATSVWPHEFSAGLHIALDAEILSVTLEIANTGRDAFAFTCALHTYLAVDDAGAAALQGLDGCRYEDSADGGAIRRQDGAVTFHGEVDRIYGAAPAALHLDDRENRMRIVQHGFMDTVVWNPGETLAGSITDLAPGDHRRFVCVEAAQVLQPVRLSPGERWQGTQRLR